MTEREKIVAFCEWGIRNAAQIHYAQVRPIRHPSEWPAATRQRLLQTLPLITDCSGFATMAYQYAGAPDPNGAGFNGTGYTGTLMRHGRKVTTPLPGDLIIFGDFPGHHVTIFMYEWHGAWVTCSHGQEIGPLRVLNHREELAQGVPYQVRRYF